MSYDRFEHEQQVMRCWGIVEDLRELNAAVMDTGLTTDKISNVLMGMAELYDLKFNTLWNLFEQSISCRAD